MRKPLLIVFLSLTGLALLAAVALGVFLAVFNPNEYKEHLSAAVEKATGRSLQFQGDLEVHIFPELSLKTGRVVMRDADMFGDRPFLAVDSAVLRISLDSLVDRSIKVEEVALNGASLNLMTAATGQRNWEYGFTGQRSGSSSPWPEAAQGGPAGAKTPLDAPEAPESGAGGTESKSARFALSIREIRCADSKVTYRDMQKGTAYSGTLDSFTLLGVHESAILPLTLSGTVRDDNSGHKARFGIGAELRVSAAGALLSAGVRSFELQGDGFAAGPFLLRGQASVGYDQGGERALHVSDLRGSLSLLPEEGAENSAPLDTEYANGRIVFTPARDMRAARIDGNIELTSLDADAILRRMSPAASSESGVVVKGAPNLTKPRVGKARAGRRPARDTEEAASSEKKQDSGEVSAASVGNTGISPVDGNFTITVGSLSVRSFPIRNLRAELRAREGNLTAPFTLELFKATVNGTATAEREKGVPSFSLSALVKGLDMAEATRALTGSASISGLLAASVTLSGKGNTQEEIMHSLSGKAEAQVGAGEIRGFRLIPSDLPGLKPVPVNFPFDRLSASANIRQGVATSKDISLQSKVLSARGGGRVRLAYGQADLGVDFLLGGLPPAVPVSISGPYGALSYSVDVRTFMRNVAESAGELPQDAARSLLRNIGGLLQ